MRKLVNPLQYGRKYNQCTRKHRYCSKAKAQKAIKEIRPKRNQRGRLNAYHCPYCGEWHIGRTKRREQ